MITAQGLTKYYGDKCAISDLSFEIEQGEIVGFLGLNGAGKTTALRVLACLLLPSAGRVTIGGKDVTEQPHEVRQQVGFLPEEPPLYQEMTVESYLTFAGELRGLGRAAARRRTEEVLEVTQTKEVRSEVIGNLSFGFRKRVGIGQAIVHQPPLLILDEPVSGLDPLQIVEMREMILGLRGKHTILLSSHNLPEISQTCDRIIVIQKGRIAAVGTEKELTSHLSGSHRLRLVVRGTEEQALQVLRQVDHVTGWEVVDRTGDLLQLRVVTETDRREELARALVTEGLGLLHLGPAEAELESIFIELTQKKEVAA